MTAIFFVSSLIDLQNAIKAVVDLIREWLVNFPQTPSSFLIDYFSNFLSL